MANDPRERVVFDYSHLPVLIVRNPQIATLGAVDEWFDLLTKFLAEAPGPIAMIHDNRRMEFTTVRTEARHAVARALQRLELLPDAAKIVSDCRIVANPVIAAIVNTVNWVHGPSPWKRDTFTTEEAALEWSHRMLREFADKDVSNSRSHD